MSSSGLGAPTTLAPRVLESNEPIAVHHRQRRFPAPVTAPATATPVSAPAAAAPAFAPGECASRRGERSFRRPKSAPSASNACAQIPTAFKPAVQRTRRVIQNGAVRVFNWGLFASKAPKPARYSNVCKQKHNTTVLIASAHNRSQVSVLSISVNDTLTKSRGKSDACQLAFCYSRALF